MSQKQNEIDAWLCLMEKMDRDIEILEKTNPLILDLMERTEILSKEWTAAKSETDLGLIKDNFAQVIREIEAANTSLEIGGAIIGMQETMSAKMDAMRKTPRLFSPAAASALADLDIAAAELEPAPVQVSSRMENSTPLDTEHVQ